jgi:hypothetical protein
MTDASAATDQTWVRLRTDKDGLPALALVKWRKRKLFDGPSLLERGLRTTLKECLDTNGKASQPKHCLLGKAEMLQQSVVRPAVLLRGRNASSLPANREPNRIVIGAW